MTLSSSRPHSIVSQTVTFTVTVAVSAPATGTPTGQVVIKDGSSPIATVSLPSGSNTVAVPIAFTTAGTHTISAVYQGDASFTGSSSGTLTQIVFTQNQALIHLQIGQVLHNS